MEHTALVEHTNGFKFRGIIGDHSFMMDSPAEGEPGAGPSPKKMLLTSLATCTGIDVVSILEKMKVSFADFSIETTANMTDEHPKVYDQFKLIYNIKVAKEDQSRVNRAVELSVEKYCGVMEMFRKFAKINLEINFK